MTAVGCSQKMNMDETAMQSEINKKDKEIQELRATAGDQEQQIQKYQSQLGAQGKMGSGQSGLELLPPGANPGQCFARVFVPPKYITSSEEVLKREASERIEIIPANYEWVQEQVLVQEASERLELIPAKYSWVEEKVMVKSAASQMNEIPASYEWVEEQILVEPAHTAWKKGNGLVEKLDNTTGEIMCLVNVPATYKTVKKRVLREPAKVQMVEIPASYQVVKKKIMSEPPTQRKVLIPAEYKTVKVRKMVTPPQEKRITIPAEYQTISRTKQVSDGQMEWRRVMCETNLTRDVISDIQSALQKTGYDPGPVDGTYGWRTKTAIQSYQKSKGLPTGGLTHDTIKSLGISI